MVQIIHTTLPFLPFLSLLALTLQVQTASAAIAPLKLNDWSVPCFQGRCAYDLPEADVDNSTSGSSGGSGSLQIVSRFFFSFPAHQLYICANVLIYVCVVA